MKKVILPLLSAIGALSPTFSSAADYYFIPPSKDNTRWNHLENWKISEDGGQSFANATDYPSASDNVFFDQTKIAEFTIADDGLYVSYNTVPEPAAVAALVGAVALLFALRRKK